MKIQFTFFIFLFFFYTLLSQTSPGLMARYDFNLDLQKDKDELNKMMKIYKSKDIEGMLKMMDDSDNKITSDNQDVLLNNRNKNWIPVMIKTMKAKPTFFGVGAGHLAGEEGVIKLLRKEGFTVEAVN